MTTEEQSSAADDALNAAAAEVQDVEQEVVENDQDQADSGQQESVDTDQAAGAEQSAEEPDRLPTDHSERSNLGRKLSAYHRRVDGLENKLDRIATLLESNAESSQEQGNVDMDEPLTLSDLEKWQAQQEAKKKKTQEKYDDDYRNAVIQLGGDLDQAEWDAIIAEMNKMPLNPSGNPALDAERNFNRAQVNYLRSRVKPGRKNPLEDKKPTGNAGVATSQKNVVKEAALPKIDGAAQSYLDMVAREDGDEKAQKLRKSLA